MTPRSPLALIALILVPLATIADEPKPVAEIKLEAEGTAVTFSPDGKLIAVASMDPYLRQNDVLVFNTQGFSRTPFRVNRPKDRWQWVEFSPDSKHLAGVSILGPEVIIWETSTGKEVAKLTHKGAAWSA